jgi:hypothetical protein
MTTKPNPFVSSMPLELRISADPRNGSITMRTNRPAPTVQLLAMVLDAAPILFKTFCEQQAGIVGGNDRLKVEVPPEPEPEKVV